MYNSHNNVNAIPLPIESRLKWFVNNQRFTDVQFVVGAERQLIFAHKVIIASGSPVFEQMFFANHNLKMTGGEPIEIPDLTSAGFINMLKYIYTNKLEDLDLAELFETYMAGDKYQVYNMSETIFAFIKNILSTSNCCIIYDQLLKFPTEYVVPLDEVKKLIRHNSESAFKNKYFVNISQETLVDLLNMDCLFIKEVDVLNSCAKWVDEEIKRLNLQLNRANKQMVFEPIKNLIRFSEITFDELKNCEQFNELLSSDELSSLFLHLLYKSKFTVDCTTARIRLELKSAYCNKTMNPQTYNIYNVHDSVSELSLVFKATKSISITVIRTFFPTTIRDLKLSIYNMANGPEVQLNYETLLSIDKLWYFQFVDPVVIDSTREHKFVFKFQNTSISFSQLSQNTKMILQGGYKSSICNLTSISNNGYHCLKQIDYFYSIS